MLGGEVGTETGADRSLPRTYFQQLAQRQKINKPVDIFIYLLA